MHRCCATGVRTVAAPASAVSYHPAMTRARLGACAINQTPLAWDHNRANILSAIEHARAAGVEILCLPELCITGYGCEDAFFSEDVARRALESLETIAPKCTGLAVSVGLPIRIDGILYNGAAFIVDGVVAGIVCKRFLAGSGVHYEPRWFRAWEEKRETTLDLPSGAQVPVGDLLFTIDGVRIGFEICEDAWVNKNRPGYALKKRGCHIILNPSASHFAFGKHAVRRELVTTGSREFGVAYAYANLLGNEAGRIIYDGDVMIAANGEIVAEGSRFSFADHELTWADVEARTGDVHDLNEPVQALIPVHTEFVFGEKSELQAESLSPEWEPKVYSKHEEFAHAVALGLFDYGRKSHSKGFVVSLSGGADSAACAVLVNLMLRFAAEQLTLPGALEKLGLTNASGSTFEEAMGSILLCAYQATSSSGEVTRTAAREVATALHAEFHELDIDAIVNSYVSLAQDVVKRSLEWERDDLALQNIQARVRSPGIWLLANLRGALLLTTSNRSEAAVGYATMDGDTSGGLAPLGGIDKHYLREWLRWMEHEGPHHAGAVPALKLVNAQAPTAELRPGGMQTDEKDLMPYEILDRIERAAIGEKQSPMEVFKTLTVERPNQSSAEIAGWVARFFKAFAASQWKRERYAPAFHLDDQNLDPKTWCRFPILSGGFEKELEELSVSALSLQSSRRVRIS